MNVAIWAFIVTLALLTTSGALSVIRKQKTPEDYLVASRKVRPWLTALSTVATNNSGFMFIGLIGYTYQFGFEAIWLMFGWIVGDFVVWLFVHPRVRKVSGELGANTIPLLMGSWRDGMKRSVVIIAGLITIAFLGIYAAAQLKAGSTALHALFGWDMQVGALIGAAIVIIYSYAGGIRADIWTDAAQSFAMLGSMGLILIAGFLETGGPAALAQNLGSQDPQLVQWYPANLEFGALAFVVGYVFAGLGTVGQPHLMTRLMAVESPEAIPKARIYYFLWYVTFFLASIGVGLYCRAILPDLTEMAAAQEFRQPAHLALPLLTRELLPEMLVGVALAGLFAATVSTADSQIIVCSGTITQEITRRWNESYLASKVATLGVTAFALGIALYAPEGVFGLVLIAWSAMGAALGPVLVARVFNLPMAPGTAVAMMLIALGVVTAWHFSGYDDDILKIFPGAIAAALVYGLWFLFIYRRRKARAGDPSKQAG